MLKSVFLGCGPRARAHARAYRHVRNGAPIAACDIDSDRRQSFGAEFGIENCYHDAHEMLEKERPDLVHIVTAPGLRVELMTLVSDHNVPVALVEKPIALQGEDWAQLRQLNQKSGTRFLVNTQLHFHPRNVALRRDVLDGKIGDVRFIDISARSTILDQGVHVLELAHSYNEYSDPVSVFAGLSGTKTLSSHQPSPDIAVAAISFVNSVRAQMVTGALAPSSNPNESIYHHKRIAVYGSAGFVHWTMVGWERMTATDGYSSGTHDYGTEDELAQAALTDSAFEYRQNPDGTHATRLELSLMQFNIILGAYKSFLEKRPINLPCDPPPRLLDSLAAGLTQEGSS